MDISEDKVIKGTEQADAEWKKLSVRISDIINTLLKGRSIKPAKMAKDIGYSQSSLSDTLNAGKPKRNWSMPLLILVANYLDVRVSSILACAEKYSEDDSWLNLYLEGTLPRSAERLDRIIKAWTIDDAPEDALLHSVYTATMFKVVVPQYAAEYLAGKRTDLDLWCELRVIGGDSSDGAGFWEKVKARLTALPPK